MNQDFLRQMVLFKNLEDTQLVELLTICVTKKVYANTRIFAEGEQASKLFLIREGEVRISRMIPGSGEEALAILKAGDFFGEMALIDERVRSAYAIAHTDCLLMEILIPDLLNLMNQDKEIGCKFLWSFCTILSARLRATNDKIYGLFAMTSFFR